MTPHYLPEKGLPTQNKQCVRCARRKRMQVATIMLGAMPLCVPCAVVVIVEQRKAHTTGQAQQARERRQYTQAQQHFGRRAEKKAPWSSSATERSGQNRPVYVEGTITYPGPVTQPAQHTSPLSRQRVHWKGLHSILLLSLSIVVLLLGSQYAISLSAATIIVSPAQTVREAMVVVTAMTTPGPATQSRARWLSATATSKPRIVVASGRLLRPATHAIGILTWFNQAPSVQTIPAGTTISAGGIQVVTQSTVIIPGGLGPAAGEAAGPAQALQAGAGGNIARLSINSICPCEGLSTQGVAVKNLSAFGGGQDKQQLSFVEPSDLATAVAPQRNTLISQALGDMRRQLGVHEQLATSPSCVQHVWSELPAGSLATQTLVSLTVSCTTLAIDLRDVARKALLLYLGQPPLLEASYVLSHYWMRLVGITKEASPHLGTLLLSVQVVGQWRYRLDRIELGHLRERLVGRTRQQAAQVLASMPGIGSATIEQLCPWLPLPLDPGRIQVVQAYAM